MPNTQAVGVAYSDPEFTTMYASQEIGYATGAQGTVTQATSKSTAVTLNKSMGRITMNGAELAANTAVSFTMNNSLISANDTIIVNVSGGGTAAAYTTYISSMTTGSAVVTLRNLTSGALSEAVILNFATIHGATG
jgi:1-aminocyclopropane-1-carboxylate deaminase/D-cysteine desulfhydrase-like pyridoxal-dependent ACC family enzyme